MQRGKNTREWATAYHEAGHAVVGCMIGLHVKGASIVGDDDSHGRVRTKNVLRGTEPAIDHSGRTRFYAELIIRQSLAGGLAQKTFSPRSHWQKGSVDDRKFVEELALRLSDSSREVEAAFLRWLELDTQAILNRHWAAVERVAAELIRHKTLTGKELNAIIRQPRRGGVIVFEG